MHKNILSCDIHTDTPARKSSTNFQLYYFVFHICATNWLGLPREAPQFITLEFESNKLLNKGGGFS